MRLNIPLFLTFYTRSALHQTALNKVGFGSLRPNDKIVFTNL
jgi:hypothetical protein